jgi:aspartate aminotransferase, mitochondrial
MLARRLQALVAAPVDPVCALTKLFAADRRPGCKVNLGVEVYRDDAGRPWVLPSVATAASRVAAAVSGYEAGPVEGLPEFVKAVHQLTYGPGCPAMATGRTVGFQTLSGTGALRLGLELVAAVPGAPRPPLVLVPDCMRSSHGGVAQAAGCAAAAYRCVQLATGSPDVQWDFAGMCQDLEQAPQGTVVVLPVGGHNPVGVGLAPDQWVQLGAVMAARDLVPFFDVAFQGLATGDPEVDAWPIRHFVATGHCVVVAQSMDTTFRLYSERVGALSVVTPDGAAAATVVSHVRRVARVAYGAPPLHGARVVAEVLRDPFLRTQWLGECAAMAARLRTMRSALRDALVTDGPIGVPAGSWDHINTQQGMVCHTGLRAAQVDRLREDYGVYMAPDGRMSVAGLNTGNVQYVADSVRSVIRVVPWGRTTQGPAHGRVVTA